MKKPILKPWDHPNILTWERRQGSVVVASILRSYSELGVTATVIVNGQKERASFPDVLPAQVWCDALLLPSEKTEPTVQPEADPVERLIRWLETDPDLAWYVATQVPVLGPWTKLENRWQRSAACGFNVAIVRGPPVAFEWHWALFAPTDGAAAETDFAAGFGSLEDACQACDRRLRDLGWALATKKRLQPRKPWAG